MRETLTVNHENVAMKNKMIVRWKTKIVVLQSSDNKIPFIFTLISLATLDSMLKLRESKAFRTCFSLFLSFSFIDIFMRCITYLFSPFDNNFWFMLPQSPNRINILNFMLRCRDVIDDGLSFLLLSLPISSVLEEVRK